MKIFIAGGTGFVGGHVVDALLASGHEIRLLVHRRSAGLSDRVEQVVGDVTELDSCARAAEGCDAVVNLVGIIREFPGRGVTFERLHVRATANLLTVARNAGITRYLQMSALGTRADAVSRYHKTKFRGEELVGSSGLDTTIFRPSLIYGPKDAFVNMLAGQLRMVPVMPVMGSGDYRLQPIHASDVARCFAQSLDMPGTIGRCYELCGNNRMTYVEMLDEIAAAIGRSVRFMPHLPLVVMKPLVAVMQHIPLFPITSDQLQMLLEENICGGEWKREFGFEPREFAAGIREYLKP